MISEGFEKNRIYNGLRLRMIAMLSLALLPIGFIAVTQTASVTNAARETAQLSLKLMTEQAAFHERLAIERAAATADVVASEAAVLLENTQTCGTVLSTISESNKRFSNISIVGRDGKTMCTSSGNPFDFEGTALFDEVITAQRPVIAMNTAAGGDSIMIVTTPFAQNGTIGGFASVSIPHSELPSTGHELSDQGLINLITLRPDGQVITSRKGRPDMVLDLPANLNNRVFLDGSSDTFYARSIDGRDLLYAVVPVRGSTLYVMGVWSTDAAINAQLVSDLPPGTFPALMWLISLFVSLFAVNRLVTRHIRLLGRQMAHFAANRRAVKAISTAEMPTELRDIQDSFLQMAGAILQDEATMEDSVREKNVLLKEIHHRVKNNLQLISSIINMQVRSTPDPETKAILRRIQDRVLSLATIHRDLYQGANVGRVNVGALVKEVVEKSVDIGIETQADIDITTDISDVHLYPDQAVPLSLLASEATTNAMKYLGATDGNRPYLTVSLVSDNLGRCDFIFENSVGAPTSAESTGLGAQLIKAFAIQLGAKMEVEQTDTVYQMHLSFQIVDFQHETANY